MPKPSVPDLADQVAQKSAHVAALIRQRDSLRRAPKAPSAARRRAIEILDAAAARYAERLPDKLRAIAAPTPAPLRLFSGPDGDALSYFLRDSIVQALNTIELGWQAPPPEIDGRIAALDEEIAVTQAEIDGLRLFF